MEQVYALTDAVYAESSSTAGEAIANIKKMHNEYGESKYVNLSYMPPVTALAEMQAAFPNHEIRNTRSTACPYYTVRPISKGILNDLLINESLNIKRGL